MKGNPRFDKCTDAKRNLTCIAVRHTRWGTAPIGEGRRDGEEGAASLTAAGAGLWCENPQPTHM